MEENLNQSFFNKLFGFGGRIGFPRILLHGSLFLLTFFTTTTTGVFWLNLDSFDLSNFHFGISYSISILFILTCHEFGHYFASRYHRVNATLPYFIPAPPFLMNFGTFGAVIRTKSVIQTKKILFDIGVAGPIAGFMASLIVLFYGFLNLPSPQFILSIHPDYNFIINSSTGHHGASLVFGDTILFSMLRNILTNPSVQFVPPMSEIYHYPYLCAGWFGLLITALNLIPIGQFDGGHLTYSMFGETHKKIARSAFYILVLLSVPAISDTILRGILEFIYKKNLGQIIPFAQYSSSAWLVWALIARYLIKLYHPVVPDETPLDPGRKIIGWLCILIFILTISLNPISFSE